MLSLRSAAAGLDGALLACFRAESVVAGCEPASSHLHSTHHSHFCHTPTLLVPFTHFPCAIQVIAEHLFHEGLFDIGRRFVEEAGVAGGEALQRPYASMHTVLQEVGAGWLGG